MPMDSLATFYKKAEKGHKKGFWKTPKSFWLIKNSDKMFANDIKINVWLSIQKRFTKCGNTETLHNKILFLKMLGWWFLF